LVRAVWGEVYRARDTRLKRDVAIKLMVANITVHETTIDVGDVRPLLEAQIPGSGRSKRTNGTFWGCCRSPATEPREMDGRADAGGFSIQISAGTI
jgi:hypothetical protein